MKKLFLVCYFISFLIPTLTFSVSMPKKTVQKEDIYIVVLAGGNGERLWPLSRKTNPKQLLTIENDQTLLDQSVNRVKSLVNKETIWISTTQQHASKIEEMVSGTVGRVLAEPGLRNTGPAILLSCLEIYKKNPNAIIIFVPADQFIPAKDNEKYLQFLEEAIDYVVSYDTITLLGVRPTYPATGYGYIEFENENSTQMPYQVKKFHEKPLLEVAQQYLDSGSMLWNIGMFCGKASVFIQEFQLHAHDIYDGVKDFLEGRRPYDSIKSESIDYAVMEKSKRITVLPVNFSWYDIGNIEIFLTIKNACGGLSKNRTISAESKNNLVDVPNKLVALIGVEDLCVVETDEVLLITKRNEAEKVRAIVKTLKESTLKEYL